MAFWVLGGTLRSETPSEISGGAREIAVTLKRVTIVIIPVLLIKKLGLKNIRFLV